MRHITEQRFSRFLENIESPNTYKNYKTGIKAFLYWKNDIKSLKKQVNIDELADKYFDELISEQVLSKFETDLEQYLLTIRKRPPKTVKAYLNAIRQFMSYYDVEPARKFWKEMRRVQGKRRGTATRDRVPSNDELKRIIMHLPIQGKAVIILLATSGLRVGEALNLDLQDVHLGEYSTVKNLIEVRGEFTRNGRSRDAFFSTEAEEVLIEWLRNRERYLHQAMGRSAIYERDKHTTKLFPFTVGTLYNMWHTALKKSGNGERDRVTNIHKLHIHVLRKLFRTRLGIISQDETEALMGHEGYLTSAYRKLTRQELYDFYAKNQHVLSILGGMNKDEFDELRQKQAEDRDTLSEVVKENLELRKQVIDLESQFTNQVDELQRQLHEIQTTRRQSDQVMDRLFEDPEFRDILRKKLRETG